MDDNTCPEARAVPKGKILSTIVAGLIVLGIAVGCGAPAPQAAPRVQATVTALVIPQPIAAPTVRAGGPTVASLSTTTTLTPGQHQVRRKVTIEHPEQSVGAARRAVRVGALSIPADPPSFPAKGNNTVKHLMTVWEPDVKFADNDSVATTFNPPLKITVEFTADDSKRATRGADGKPRLYLFTWYREGNAIKWEKLATTVTCTGSCDTGTLNAQISNLRPNDPVSEGFD